jgi:Uma2 family endonuclease
MQLITIPQTFQVTEAQFYELAIANRDLRLERTSTGELIVMPPTGTETGNRNQDISGQLWQWNRRTKLGIVFDSSTGFTLPNGSKRSPDASWVKLSRWQALTPSEQEGFAPICPDFVVELRSKSDSIKTLREKMQEYSANGASLGWLINRSDRQVEIYRHRSLEILYNPASLSGEDLLPSFILDLTEVW